MNIDVKYDKKEEENPLYVDAWFLVLTDAKHRLNPWEKSEEKCVVFYPFKWKVTSNIVSSQKLKLWSIF